MPPAATPSRNPAHAIRTISGDQFWPTDPRPEEIVLDVIAHHLSQVNRFVGATREPYSVAQHSLLVSRLVPREFALWGLLHDASEAYLNDVARPIKYQSFMKGYRAVELVLQARIYARFGLTGQVPSAVDTADDLALHAEIRDLLVGGDLRHAELANAAGIPCIVPQSPSVVKLHFLARFRALDAERSAEGSR